MLTAQTMIEYLKKTRNWEPPEINETVVLCFSPFLGNDCNDNGMTWQPFLGAKLWSSGESNVQVVTDFGVGAPAAAAKLDECISLGAKSVHCLGTAGSIEKDQKIGDFCLIESGFIEEGTSKHYGHSEEEVQCLQCDDKKVNLLFPQVKRVSTVTTDAPYRSHSAAVKNWHQMGAHVVEMEATALMSVANFYNIELYNWIVISDEILDDQWKPGFHFQRVKNELRQCLSRIIEVSS